MKSKKVIKKSRKQVKKIERDTIPANIQPCYDDLLAEINISRRFLEAFPAGY